MTRTESIRPRRSDDPKWLMKSAEAAVDEVEATVDTIEETANQDRGRPLMKSQKT